MTLPLRYASPTSRRTTRRLIAGGILALVSLVFHPLRADQTWPSTVKRELPLLGHRNWICVVDSAYPWQTSPGVETVETGADELTVVRQVLAILASAKHVQPVIFTDSEMAHVPEADAPGITQYRRELAEILKGRNIQVVAHAQTISDLDEAGKTFHVLILKTTLTIPYTSVFMRLECGYWNAAAEQRLRDAMH